MNRRKRRRIPAACRAMCRGERSGFGLVELVVAITITTVVILGVGVSHTTCLNLTRTSEETNAAVSDLRAAMESVLLTPLVEVPDPEGPFAEGQPIEAFTDLHLRNERIVADYPGYDGGVIPNPLEIVLQVTWTDFGGRTRSLSMATSKTR